MIKLARTVRFSINFDDFQNHAPPGGHNTFAGWPSMRGLGAWYEVVVTCCGKPDEKTGYLVNIKEIDAAVRADVIPVIAQAIHERPGLSPGVVLPDLTDALRLSLGEMVACVQWRLSPYYSVAMSTDRRDEVIIRETFEFAAAHRLHVDSMSSEENRQLFGKCNNPSGHGHNYQVEVAVATPFTRDGSSVVVDNLTLERIVDSEVIERFDHKNLDCDTPEFADRNSSVEHIARVCHDLLRDPIANAGGTLEHVTVWETGKTSCTYPA